MTPRQTTIIAQKKSLEQRMAAITQGATQGARDVIAACIVLQKRPYCPESLNEHSRDAPPAARVAADGGDHGDGGDAPLVAALDVGRVEPGVGHRRAVERPSAQLLDVVVQARGDGAHPVWSLESLETPLFSATLCTLRPSCRWRTSRPRRQRGRGRPSGSARPSPPGRSCRSGAWGCAASACRRRWRGCARRSRFGCSLRLHTAGWPRRPSRRSRSARRDAWAAPACRWRRRRNGTGHREDKKCRTIRQTLTPRFEHQR